MQYPSSETESDSSSGDCLSPDASSADYDDYISVSSLRSIKRAKSTRDAYPPSQFRTSVAPSLNRRPTYLNARNTNGRRSHERFESLRRASHDWSSAFEPSDCESVPDLSDSNSASESVQSAITPTKPMDSTSFSFEFLASVKHLSLSLLEPKPSTRSVPKPSIFDIPELVYKIIEYADFQNTVIPKETLPVRRRPLSLHHATLLYDGDREKAKSVMQSPTRYCANNYSDYNALHTCLLVNKLFHRIAKEVLGKKILFSKEENYLSFVNSGKEVFETTKPQVFVLNKLFHARQASLDKIAETIDYSSLEWLEIFMCPRLKPSNSLLHKSLRSLVVTGSKVLDDSMLVSVAKRCPNLETLDVRACERITDSGIFSIGSRCHNLRSINLGRKENGHLITDYGVVKLAIKNPHLHTVGLAGCHITDRTIWQLAMSCGAGLERLSLNNCVQLTNESIPTVLSHDLMPMLSVLEIRFIENLTDFDSILTFKRKQSAKGISVLIETCETLLYRLKSSEKKMDNHISRRIYQDIAEWANRNDEDASYEELIKARAASIRSSQIFA